MTITTDISFGYKSDIGRRRDTNEDSCAVLNHTQLNGKLDGLLIVADGLGGRRAGEIASSLLVETISFGVLETTSMVARPMDAPGVEQLLHDTIVRANGTIMTQGRFHKREETRGMATTCVSAIIHNGELTIANVGDSRIYLLRAGAIRQLTTDHSEVFMELAKGEITQEEARNHKFRNQITRAVGLEPNVRPDISTLPLNEGDTLLLCSDGLTTEVPDELLGQVLSAAPDAQSAADNLVALALKSGGRDNVTVVVMRYGEFVPTATFDLDLEMPDAADTDPSQDWRSEEDYEDDLPPKRKEPESSRFSGYAPATVTLNRSKAGGYSAAAARLLPAICGLLLLAVLVLGAINYNLRHSEGVAVAPPLPNAGLPAAISTATNVYGSPELISDTPVMPDLLQISLKGNPVVATMDGTVQTFILNEHKLLPMQGMVPSLPAMITPAPKSHGKTRADVCLDTSGNLYYINPATKCIETYNSSGTRTNQDLGKGKLTAPTKLAVDAQGSIYVIDNCQLKVLSVAASPHASAHPANAGF